MTPIRPDILPPSPGRPQADDHGKLAAQRAFFAQALSQAQGAAAPAAPTPVSTPATAPASVQAAAPGEPPQKVLRPGSLVDIRV